MDALPAGVRLVASALAYTLAYGIGLALFVAIARRRGLSTRETAGIAVAALFGGLIGATALQIAVSGEPGKTVLGGIAGGWVAVIFAKRELRVRRPLGDAFAFALAGGEAVGRIGCFFAGCCYGKLAGIPWAVHDHDGFRHPTQLYSSAAALLTLAILIALERRRTLPDNGIFFVQGALFCTLRFAIEFYRDVPTYGPFTLAQYACLAGLAFFAYKLSIAVSTRGVSTSPAHAA